jgi:hypothetical protein
VEHACEHHENDAESDERNPREPNRYGCAAEQAEVEPGDEIGDGRAVDCHPCDPLQACNRHENAADKDEGKANGLESIMMLDELVLAGDARSTPSAENRTHRVRD